MQRRLVSPSSGPLLWASMVALAGAPALPAAERPAVDPHAVVRALNQAFIEAVEAVSPAVVVLDVLRPRSGDDPHLPFWDQLPPSLRRRLFPEGEERELPPLSGQGSGVVIREDGYILTNSHVVENAEKITVRFKDGRRFEGRVQGIDKQSDLAVVKIDAEGLPVAKLGDSDAVRVGEFAIAIGAPFELEYSVTFGHVSAKGRSGILPDPAMDQRFIQTDANINPGNSGGPLVNIEGEVIGINTLIRGMNTGIGFAIPSNLAREVAEQLIAHGKFTRAWLGVEIRSLRDSPDVSGYLDGLKQGVVVLGILRGGPASKSELRPGDLIVAVAGQPVATAQDLKDAIRSKPIGQPVALEVVRGGRKLQVDVVPEAWPEETEELAARGRRRPAEVRAEDLGLTARPLTAELAERYGLDLDDGLVVAEVAPGSPAERAGLRPGDLLTEVNGRPVRQLRELREACSGVDLKKGVPVQYLREGMLRFALIREGEE